MKISKLLTMLLALCLCVTVLAGCVNNGGAETSGTAGESKAPETESQTDEIKLPTEPGIYFNGKAVTFAEEGNTDLDLLSVENGIEIVAVTEDGEGVKINGKDYKSPVSLDVDAITREQTVSVEITKGEDTKTHTVNLMPSTFRDYVVEGKSETDGDFLMSTCDEKVNYVFKLNNDGDLIFYKKTGSNALDFRKEYNSKGEVRYTYMPYLAGEFCGIQGINPGCVEILDENYDVIEQVYFKGENGEDVLIDPHGFVYIDDGHYIVTAYEDVVVKDIPAEYNAKDNSAYLAILLMQEIKDGEILWEFSSLDHPEFIDTTTVVKWDQSTDYCHDYVHFNSMCIDNDGNLLVSCRNINSILKVSRKDGSLIWTLGGKNDEFGLTADQIFSKQHSIILTEDGNYMIFNNGNDEVASGATGSSSVIRLKLDEENKKVVEYREVEANFYSSYMGAIREIDAENRIYLWTVGGAASTCDWTVVEYSEETGATFKFHFDGGYRKMYAANKG